MKPQDFTVEEIRKKSEEWSSLSSQGKFEEIVGNMSSLFISSQKGTSPERESICLRYPLELLIHLLESGSPPSEEQIKMAFLGTLRVGFGFDTRKGQLNRSNERLRKLQKSFEEEQDLRTNCEDVISSRNAELESLRKEHHEQIEALNQKLEDLEERLAELRDNEI